MNAWRGKRGKRPSPGPNRCRATPTRSILRNSSSPERCWRSREAGTAESRDKTATSEERAAIMKHVWMGLWLTWACAFGIVPGAAAQTNAGLRGVVKDQSGGGLPGVSVVAQDVDTGPGGALVTHPHRRPTPAHASGGHLA